MNAMNDWAKAQMESEERALAKLATDAKTLLDSEWVDTGRLVSVVNSIAFSQGEMHAYEPASHADDPAEVTKYLTRLALNGPDDTWSGRGNDTRRSQYEGLLKGVERTLQEIERLTREEAKAAS